MYIDWDGKVSNDTIYNSKIKSCSAGLCLGEAIIFWVMSFMFSDYKWFFWGISLVCFILLLCLISFYYAKYDINEMGVLVKYPLESKKIIQWNEFQQVCICYVFKNRMGGRYVAICFVKNGQKKTLFPERWKTDNLFRHRQILIMDYTLEMYKKVKKMCPYEVVDLRETPGYLHSAFGYHKYQRLQEQERDKQL